MLSCAIAANVILPVWLGLEVKRRKEVLQLCDAIARQRSTDPPRHATLSSCVCVAWVSEYRREIIFNPLKVTWNHQETVWSEDFVVVGFCCLVWCVIFPGIAMNQFLG